MVGRVVGDGEGEKTGLWLRRVPIMAVRSIFETDHKRRQPILLSEGVERK